jgi:hypothetical protein
LERLDHVLASPLHSNKFNADEYAMDVDQYVRTHVIAKINDTQGKHLGKEMERVRLLSLCRFTKFSLERFSLFNLNHGLNFQINSWRRRNKSYYNGWPRNSTNTMPQLRVTKTRQTAFALDSLRYASYMPINQCHSYHM